MIIIKSQNNLLAPNNQLIKKTILQITIMAKDRFLQMLVLTSLQKALEELEMKVNMV